MKPPSSLLPWAVAVSAAKHVLYTGTFSKSCLYVLEFDSDTSSLRLLHTIQTLAPHPHISFNHDRTVLYAVEGGGSWSSYAIHPDHSLAPTGRIPIDGPCDNYTDPVMVASPVPPYNVYGAPYGNCGNVIRTDAAGAILDPVVSDWIYAASPKTNAAGVHGLQLSPDGRFLYSADLKGNTVWVHAVDPWSGAVTVRQQVEIPIAGSGPRSLTRTSHASGGYVYVLLEEAHRILQCAVQPDGTLLLERHDSETVPGLFFAATKSGLVGLQEPGRGAGAEGAARTLLDGFLFRGDNIEVAASGAYLWATVRGAAAGADGPGYVSAFSLLTTGAVHEHVLTLATPTGGVRANSVAPAFFDDQWIALAEDKARTVTVWHFDAPGKTAKVVATWSAEAGSGCCANVLWYS